MIETERLRLRSFTPDDLDDHYRLVYGQAEAMRYIGDGTPRTREQTAQLINGFIAFAETHPFTIWAVETLEGDFIGQCGLINVPNGAEIEVAYAYGKPYWGQGYATEAARASVRYGFEYGGLERLIAMAYPDNKASQRVMQKIGMRHEGLTDQYHSLTLEKYSIERAAFDPGDARFVIKEGAQDDGD
ncbi:MAG: GNAT family N-acetyltransferase [Anaerolineae bacterium]|nr:GNAT family N-acetyltransferase [Anaerolineae bacterium]